ncbi:MAG: tetratricopeptide repeat protein, partial [Candidatus Acidiferrales bacterium]
MTKRKKQKQSDVFADTRGNAGPGQAAAAQNATTPAPTWTKARTHVLLLLALSFAAYGQTLRNGFVTDDNTQILMNPNVKESRSVGEIFSGDVWSFAKADSATLGVSNYYRPLQILVYAEEYELFGEKPWGWHAVNLVLNAAVVLAAYFLIASLGGAELAVWASLLFAVHPMHTEAAAWVAALPELQCGLLLMVAMLFYHRARSSGNAIWNIAISTVAFLAALFSKETALLFPAILLSYEYFYRGEPLVKLWRSARWIWPHVAVLICYTIARVLALGAFTPVYQPAREPLNATQLLLAIPAILARYVGKLVAPAGLNYFYAFPMPKSFGWWTIAGFAVTITLIAAMFLLRKPHPLLAFSVAWFLLTLAPALSVNRIGENFFTERYLYIPSLGFCILAAWGWLWLRKKLGETSRQWVAWGAGAAVLVFYAAQVERRLPVFHDNFTLLSDTIRKSPDSAEVLAQLATALYDRGDLDGAIGRMAESLELRPNHELSLLRLAQYFAAEKKYDRAIELFKKAVAQHPEYDVAWINLAKAYTLNGEWAQAAACYRRLEDADPKTAGKYEQLARVAEANEKVESELAQKQADAARRPDDAVTLVQLGDAY